MTDRDLSHLQFHASCVVTPLHAHTADGRLRESLGTTRTLLKAHASSLVTLDRRGTVVDLEPGRDAIAVRPADTRAPQRGDDYLHWCQEVGESGYGDATVLRAALEAIYAGAITTWQREFPDRDAAPERWFEVTARTSDPPDTRTMVIWRDITARKRIELALRENERHFRVMVDAAPTMVWLAEADRRCTYFNRAWLDFTGRTLQQEVHSGWLDNMHQDDVARCREVYDHAFEAMEGFSLEYRLRRRDGAYRWIMETAVPWRRDDGSLAGFIGSAIDITERREAEEVARELSGRLIVAQEEERRRIAREVHDDCGQRLALLAIELEQLASQPPASHDELASRSGHMARASAELATDLHRLSHRLHPAKLEALGLVAAIQGFCHELSSQHGLRVQFTHQGVTRTVPSHVALCLYRIVQEGLQNVVKHSGVMKADVRLSCRNRELVLQIADPGHGFDLGRQPGAGLGLNSMQERVRSLGGQLVVHTSPGRGTRIGVRVNLDTPVGEKQTA